MIHQEHQPDPEFVARLENQLTQELQRRERLGMNARPRRDLRKRFRAAGFMLAGLVLGAGCVTTTQRIENAGRQELLLRQAEANASIASKRVDAYRQQAESADQRHEAGLISREAWEAYRMRSKVVEAELQRSFAELDVEAISVGGRPVREEISAPRVEGRDFVGERLQLELDANAKRTTLLEPLLEFQEARVRAGLNVPGSLAELTMEKDQLAASAAQTRETLRLRQSFLDGDMDAEEAELEYRLLIATTRRQFAETRLDALRGTNELVRRRVSAGVAPPSDAVVLENDIQRAEVEAQIAQLEVELIANELDPYARGQPAR